MHEYRGDGKRVMRSVKVDDSRIEIFRADDPLPCEFPLHVVRKPAVFLRAGARARAVDGCRC